MKIAVSGTEFDESEGVDGLISMARAAKCRFVELWYPKNTARDGLETTLTHLANARLAVACVATPSELVGSRSAGAQEMLVEAIRIAERCGAACVNTYFGHEAVTDDAAAIELYAARLAPVLVRAARAGILIALENEFDAFGWDPSGSDITRRVESLAALCRRVTDPTFGLTLDPANFACVGVGTEMLSLLQWVRHVHVKDVTRADPLSETECGWRRYKDSGRFFDTAPFGEGIVAWQAILKDLAAAGFDGALTLEPHCERAHLRAEVARAADALRARLARVESDR